MYKYDRTNKRLDDMEQTTRGDEWFVDEAGDIRLTTADLNGDEQETWFSREDLQSMLSALDDLEDTDD